MGNRELQGGDCFQSGRINRRSPMAGTPFRKILSKFAPMAFNQAVNWDFVANNSTELANIGDALLTASEQNVLDEQVLMTRLLEVLSGMEVLQYPVKVRHTGKNGVPDFALESGSRSISIEMAKVTNQNLEHARSFQRKLPERRSHFLVQDVCNSSALVRRLKFRRDRWSVFVASRAPPDTQQKLETWSDSQAVPTDLLEALVNVLNSVVDGPPLSQEPTLQGFVRAPVEVEKFPSKHTAYDNKWELEDAFWEELARPINPTLMVHRFWSASGSRMDRQKVVEMGFTMQQMEFGGPTIEEDEQIWLGTVRSELDDKSHVLNGSQFCHGDEDWLVLSDLLGSAEWQLNARQVAVSKLLARYWKPGWFTCVFLRDHRFSRQLIFTAPAMLPGQKDQP